MGAELRAALAIARKDIRTMFRYRIAVVGLVFNPLYQGVIPAFLFGASFAVAGRVTGLETTVGSGDLAGFIFLGGVISGLVAFSFWAMAFGLRMEMDNGTLEPSWLTPTRRDTLLLGRAIYAVALFLLSQAALFVVGIAFFGLRIDWSIVLALPALGMALAAMVGVAYMVAAVVLLMREANFFVDTANFLFSVASGVAFPITLLPGAFQAVAILLPTTYAVDILRAYTIGTRPLLDLTLEHVVLLGLTLLLFPVGRAAFNAADRRLRVTGGIGQH
ncbi:MAG TPA: ABC transporter permease [Candidatus Limnocylindria bacterium]|nr:ABC transporter permease [Candidatus Limnocylindria bacterium]